MNKAKHFQWNKENHVSWVCPDCKKVYSADEWKNDIRTDILNDN